MCNTVLAEDDLATHFLSTDFSPSLVEGVASVTSSGMESCNYVVIETFLWLCLGNYGGLLVVCFGKYVCLCFLCGEKTIIGVLVISCVTRGKRDNTFQLY